MTQELKKLKTQEDMYQAYLQNTPDTPEMEHNRHQYAQGLRLLQIRIKKLQDQLEQVKYGRYLKQVDGENVTPPPARQLPYPKFTKTMLISRNRKPGLFYSSREEMRFPIQIQGKGKRIE